MRIARTARQQHDSSTTAKQARTPGLVMDGDRNNEGELCASLPGDLTGVAGLSCPAPSSPSRTSKPLVVSESRDIANKNRDRQRICETKGEVGADGHYGACTKKMHTQAMGPHQDPSKRTGGGGGSGHEESRVGDSWLDHGDNATRTHLLQELVKGPGTTRGSPG
jgi:hypothetical protein